MNTKKSVVPGLSVIVFSLLVGLMAVLFLAQSASGAWVKSTIDSEGDVGWYSSIAIDSNNKVHISYYDRTDGDLKYATDASGSLVKSTIIIDNVGCVEHHYTSSSISIAIDSNNNVHISYCDYANEALKYATNASGVWEKSTTPGSEGEVLHTSIAIDSNNKVHISYYDSTNKDLKYATNASGAWVTSTIEIESEWYTLRYCSIAIDSNNKVHISTFFPYSSDIWYNYYLFYTTKNASGSWVTSIISSQSNGVRLLESPNTSIAIDSNNKVHISYKGYYTDLSSGALRYATNASGSWVTTIISDPYTDKGSYNSIAIDSNNKVHISYCDYANEALKYATNASGVWEKSTTPGSEGEVLHTSIAIDSNNKVHISYYDSTNKDLKYATNSVSYPAPDISVSPVSFDFGNVNLGSTSVSRTFTISNIRDANLVIGTISITGTDTSEFCIENDNCSEQTIAPSDTCTVDVVFSPTSAGSKSANLSIPSNDPDTPTLTVPLSGTGTAPSQPNISVSPTSHDFGSVNVGSTSAAQAFTATNTGDADLVLGTLSITGADASEFGIQNDNCSGQTVAPSGTCIVNVVFSPTSTEVKSANLSISSNDPDTPTLNMALSGTGSCVKGDINGDAIVDLTDAILALQVLAGLNPGGIHLSADVDADGKIGLAEVIYILQYVAGLRQDFTPYSIEQVDNNGITEHRFMFNKHHFMTLIDDNGTLNLRPRPGVDVNGWGSSWYVQPFLPGAVLGHTIIDSLTADSEGIHVSASGSVSYGESSTYGTWSITMDFNYNAAEKKITGIGEYSIILDETLTDTTGDLNLYKIASNYLDDVPLLSAGIGDTGDMKQADVVGDSFNFTWVPPDQPSYFPNDISDYLLIDVVGQYNNVDTEAQGYEPIEPAYKPSLKVILISQQAGLEMIFGGIYDWEKRQLFWEDNVGITPLILKQSTETEFRFNVEFESKVLPGDGQ